MNPRAPFSEVSFRVIVSTNGESWKAVNPQSPQYPQYDPPAHEPVKECVIKKKCQINVGSRQVDSSLRASASASKVTLPKNFFTSFKPRNEKHFLPVGGSYPKDRWLLILESADKEHPNQSVNKN